MGDDTPLKKSFSVWKRWVFSLDLIVRTVLVLAVMVMLNYLAARWHQRFYLSEATRQQLSPRTYGLVQSVTNHVRVIVYFDRDQDIYSSVMALLNEYRDLNSHIHVSAIDYLRDVGAAEKLKADEKYRPYLIGFTNKDLVLFESEGRVKAVDGQALAQSKYYATSEPNKYREQIYFFGESLFNAALLYVLNPKPFQAYYLVGHQEHTPDGTDNFGYSTFTSVLRQNLVNLSTLSLLGTNSVPDDCNLLVIAGPQRPLNETERDRIDDYLRRGGRLLAMVNSGVSARWTGLEGVLAGWGISVGRDTVVDTLNTTKGSDVVAAEFGDHPIVGPLVGSQLQFWLPRPVEPLNLTNAPSDSLKVFPLAFSSAQARSGTNGPRIFSLAVAAEKSNVRGVVTDHGTTRIVAVGDSIFLANTPISWPPNKDFLNYSVNWLLERTEMMQGLGPRPVAEYRLSMTARQRLNARWLMLGAIPGGVLLFGTLVWIRRRK